MSTDEPARTEPVAYSLWLNRTTIGISLASLFSDVSHELATAVLPAVLLAIGGGPASLGIIEGSADGLSAIAKLWGGMAADRVQRRKFLASAGYLVTAVGMAAIGLCTRAWQVMLCRVAAWLGRGSRSAARDVLMMDAVESSAVGKAFGIERAADAFGAVLGPLLALALLARGIGVRDVMLASIVPGALAFACIAFVVVERVRNRPATRPSRRVGLGGTGPRFTRYLVAISLFGSGDFSRTLLILYATQHVIGTWFSLRAATLAVALYVLHNAVSAVAALPIGILADRIGRRRVVLGGYAFAAMSTLGFAVTSPTPLALTILFVASGLYVACKEVGEKAYAAELLPPERKGAGMGLLAAVNGVGDMISSVLVGGLWSAMPARPAVGFAIAAMLQFAGAAWLVGMPSADAKPGQ